MDRVREIFLYFVAALAMFALLCAVYQAMNNKLGSAGVLATIFLVGGLLVFIPQIEVLKAWGVEARLRQSLDRAEEIIGRLRRLSVISAEATYTAMTWEGRLGSPTAKEKQALLDQVDAQLTSLDVSPKERAEIVGGYVKFIGLDYFNIFVRVLDRYIESKMSDSNRRLQKENSDANRKELQELSNNQNQWRASTFRGKNEVQEIAENGLDAELKRVTPNWLSPSELSAVEDFRKDLVRLFDQCQTKGGYTPEAAEFYDRYRDMAGWDLKVKELFGVDPSASR